MEASNDFKCIFATCFASRSVSLTLIYCLLHKPTETVQKNVIRKHTQKVFNKFSTFENCMHIRIL